MNFRMILKKRPGLWAGVIVPLTLAASWSFAIDVDAAGPVTIDSSLFVGVNDTERAEFNWVMHCRGCHGQYAKGSDKGAPAMAGVVSTFLHSEDGRDFLGRVPGVAFVDLSTNEVADLLNWLLQTFDYAHLPAKFIPYTADEIEELRSKALVSEAFSERERILKALTPHLDY